MILDSEKLNPQYNQNSVLTMPWIACGGGPGTHLSGLLLREGKGRMGGVRDIWAPPFGRRRLGAADWAHRLGAGTGSLPGTNGRCHLGAGRFCATVTSRALL